MIEPIVVTLPAVLFLIVLFGGGAAFRRRNIDMDGDAPINKPLFYTSKYVIVLLGAAMVARSWGLDVFVNLGPIRHLAILGPTAFKTTALFLWFLGFALLFIGRLGLGESFRVGSAKESTGLKTRGLFSVSRNPMYVGVYSTLLASALYTDSPVILLAGIFAIAVHHKIVRAEERHLLKVFGEEYTEYCRTVRRYV